MPTIDISMIGDKALQKTLNDLATKEAAKITRVALRKESYRARRRVADNIETEGLVDSGRMLAGYKSAKVKSAGRRGLIRIGIENPTRDQLGISADDKHYYPYAVEFGHDNAPAHPFIRPAIDNHKDESYRKIGQDMADGIVRAARKAAGLK